MANDSTITIHATDRFHGYVLTVEPGGRIRSPNGKQVAEAMLGLSSRGGQSYFILEAQNGHYVQVTGGHAGYVVEWQEYDHERIHYIAGYRGMRVPNARIRVEVGDGYVAKVMVNEKLQLGDVAFVVKAFLSGERRPLELSWRDMTHEILEPWARQPCEPKPRNSGQRLLED